MPIASLNAKPWDDGGEVENLGAVPDVIPTDTTKIENPKPSLGAT